MSHAEDVSPWDLLPRSVPEKRARHWWLLFVWLAVAAVTVTAATVRVQHFLYGSVPLAYISPDFGRTGWGLTGTGSRTLFAAMLVESSTVPGLPLARVDLRTGRETGQVDVPGGADDFVLSHDGKTLYVVSEQYFTVDRSNNVTRDVHSALYAVSAATGRVERQVPIPPGLLDSAVAMK